MTLGVGFIGLGDQGAPMAVAIAEHYELTVWARRVGSYDALKGAKFERAESVAVLAASVDVLCLCLGGDEDLDRLIDDGLLHHLKSGSVLVNHATGDPEEAKSFAQKCVEAGIGFLDAPVSGGRPGAEAHSLTCFIGGDAAVLERVRGVVASHSVSIIHMGTAGAGQLAKLCNNALTVSNLANIVEVFGMAERLGVSLPGLQKAFEQSSGGSFILQALGSKITPSIAAHIADLNRKDIGEFATVMRKLGMDPSRLLEWALGEPDGLTAIVDRLSGDIETA
jgi:3-hydroxyisobutyrate dehydrogenase-like beta-hydroxyacid dehydrogenase